MEITNKAFRIQETDDYLTLWPFARLQLSLAT